MTKIKLQSICLQNFKGTRFLLLNMDGNDSCISGVNGSGKTTVYKAYYWCLTGKTLEPNEVVQTLNIHNEIIHKIETAVTVTLMVDNSYEVTLQRKLVEKWKAQGRPDEELKGTEQQRFWNDVPLTQKEFDAKLSSICDLDKWLLLSDITRFMSLKTDERRRLLLSLAGDVDEEELMKPYSTLIKAVAEKKSIDELKIQTLSTKKRSNDELKTIPSQISAQDKLKSSADFEALRKEKEELDTKIADCDIQLQASPEELQSVKEYNDKITTIEKKINERKKEWQEKYDKESENLKQQIISANETYTKASEKWSKGSREQNERVGKKVELLEEFEKVKTEWNSVNEKGFDFISQDTCPTCGHKFTEEEKVQARNKAVANFNEQKAALLSGLQSNAVALNERIAILTGSLNEYNKVIGPADEKALKAAKTALDKLKAKQSAHIAQSVNDDLRIKSLTKELEEAKSQSPVSHEEKDTQTISEQKKQLTERRDIVIQELAGEQTNMRIDNEKERLELRSKELSQIIADCDKVLYEIFEYRKAKVDAVESKVNAFFNLARWKFYEKNVSNDDLQEVCICHHNGIDYNSTNGADKINLGVDIVAGLSKAYGIFAPLFVDNVESVNELIPTENQQITLRVTMDKFKME